MTRARCEFDMAALCASLDAARAERGLSWAELVAEINAPFKFVPSLPISLSTIRGMGGKASVTSAVVLQVLRWLGRSPESFLSGRAPAAGADASAEALPDVGSAADPALRHERTALGARRSAQRARPHVAAGRGRVARVQGRHADESRDGSRDRVSACDADHAVARPAGGGVRARVRLVGDADAVQLRRNH